VVKDDESFKRCNETGKFAECFYDHFLSKSPAIKQRFANTDFDVQQRLLLTSIEMMISNRPPNRDLKRHLEVIAHTHNRHNHDIPPALYDVWLESLCETVQMLDPECSDELITQWQTQLQPSINFIVEVY